MALFGVAGISWETWRSRGRRTAPCGDIFRFGSAHPSLLLEEVLQGEDHDALVPLLAVTYHRVRLPGASAPIREHCCVEPVKHPLREEKITKTQPFRVTRDVPRPIALMLS